MIDLEQEIREIYLQDLEKAKRINSSLCGKYSISILDVLRAHYQIANHFYLEGSGIGGIGVKNIDLLSSAIHRQEVAFGGKVKWTTIFEISATVFYGLIKNHAFHDANKRTAFLSLLYQLYRNSYYPNVSEQIFENLTVDIADNKLDKFARYRDYVKSGDPDPEVKYISWFLRKNTRIADKKSHTITFRQLRRILNRYEYDLDNPSGNYIDIVKIETINKGLPFFKKHETKKTKVGQIGFPRWSAQVKKSAIKSVREATKLTDKNGVDSASFFHGVDDMQSLIATYHKPLMNLGKSLEFRLP